MKTRKKQKVIIGTLVAIILGMCVGYAALSQILTITGTSGISGDFNIEFTKIDENTMVNAKTITKDGIGSTTANFTVDLEKPGSSAIYDLTVENKGTIDAILTSIEGVDESNNKEPVDITYTVTGIQERASLNAGEQEKFQVKVVWNASSTSVPTTSKSLTLKLNYEQKIFDGSISGIASEILIDEKLESDVPSGGSGLVAIGNNGEITTSITPREYRYIGPNPDNYIQFNNELWRIIGIFDGQLKIIKKDSIGSMGWNSTNVNDWTGATLQTYLNGEYYAGISSDNQMKISDYLWKLGAAKSYTSAANGLAQHFYNYERGSDAYDEIRPREWTGKITLMYPSDYGFATSGGTTTNRTKCLAKELYGWDGVSDCKNNSWLYDSISSQWTLTSYASSNIGVFIVNNGGYVSHSSVNNQMGVRPVLYLTSNTEITSGIGIETKPYILK